MESLRFLIEDLLSYLFTGVLLTFFTTVTFILFWIMIGIIFIKVGNRFLLSILKIRKNDRRTKTIAKLVNNSTKILIWFIVTVIVLSELGIDIAPLLASAGIVGVALGFGAQSIVKDLISGAFLIMERAFYEEDLVEINGFRGIVVELGLRSTSIKNWRGSIKIINNGDITDLINYSRADSKSAIDFYLSQSVNVEQIANLMPVFLKAIKKKYVDLLEEPIFLGAVEMTETSIHFRIIIHTKNEKILEQETKVRADLIEFLKQHKIELAKKEVMVLLKNNQNLK